MERLFVMVATIKREIRFAWETFLDMAWWLILAAAGIALVFGIVWAARTVSIRQCDGWLDGMNRDGYTDWWSGCMVELHDGTHVPMNNFRVNEDGDQVR
jgi:hypothetical protein